jgi:predicted DNA-binding protein (MmcQ/YjbR family)
MVPDKYVITDELTFGEVKKIYEIIKSKYAENTYTINWNNHNDECRFTTDITAVKDWMITQEIREPKKINLKYKDNKIEVLNNNIFN